VFVAAQVVGPVHEVVSANLGDRASTALNDRLMRITLDPPGIAHLERADLTDDLTMARDFDLGIMGPPLAYSVGFIAGGLIGIVSGVAAALVLAWFGWWQAIVLVLAWSSTHWLLRESGVWRDRNTPEVKLAQRHADYAFRLAVDPPASKEVRLFGLGDWVLDRFTSNRRRLYDLQYEATRLRERSVIGCLAIVATANALAFWTLGSRAADGDLSVAGAIVALQAAIGVSAIAFGGINWAMDFAAAPVASIERLEAAMADAGALEVRAVMNRPPPRLEAPAGRTGAFTSARRDPATTDAGGGTSSPELRFDDVTFRYVDGPPVLDGLDLTIPGGTSLAIVGQNGAGKSTIAKLICRLYDPQGGAITADGIDLRDLDLDTWRSGVAAVFQDFVRYELTLRENVAPRGAPDADIEAALVEAGATSLRDLGTILAKGYPGGTDLSGGQWQRVALARAVCAVRLGGGVVLLDEPTAQLDVRGEAEIFGRVLRATRGRTTILVSHRFSTVRHADRICVLERGAVVELGSHDELMAHDGRYRQMFDMQASRFVELDEEGGEILHESLS